MERGDFIRLAEATEPAPGSNPMEKELEEKFRNVTLELMENIARASREGQVQTASVAVYANRFSNSEISSAHFTLIRVSGFMQEEGFQTDESSDVDGNSQILRLAVFWGNGKRVFEEQLRTRLLAKN